MLGGSQWEGLGSSQWEVLGGSQESPRNGGRQGALCAEAAVKVVGRGGAGWPADCGVTHNLLLGLGPTWCRRPYEPSTNPLGAYTSCPPNFKCSFGTAARLGCRAGVPWWHNW